MQARIQHGVEDGKQGTAVFMPLARGHRAHARTGKCLGYGVRVQAQDVGIGDHEALFALQKTLRFG